MGRGRVCLRVFQNTRKNGEADGSLSLGSASAAPASSAATAEKAGVGGKPRVQSSTDKLYNVCGKHPHCQVDNFYILMIHFCKIVLKRGIFEPVSGFDSRL